MTSVSLWQDYLFPLNRARGFAGDVVHHTGNTIVIVLLIYSTLISYMTKQLKLEFLVVIVHSRRWPSSYRADNAYQIDPLRVEIQSARVEVYSIPVSRFTTLANARVGLPPSSLSNANIHVIMSGGSLLIKSRVTT